MATPQHSRPEVAPLIRDVIPDAPAPKASDEVKKALASSQCVVLAPRFMTEREGRTGFPPIDVCIGNAIGSRAACKAPVVPMIKHARFRPGDLVVVCVPDANAPYSHKHAALVGPLAISDHWDPSGEGGAGSVNTNTFFAALAKLATPLYPSRREDNGTFELRLA